MCPSALIGQVSETLQNLLKGEMSIVPPVHVTVLAPDESGGSDRRINLFLYKVQENATLKNMDWQVKPGDPNRLVPPPLPLNLFYLMTAYAPNATDTGNKDAHSILGDAMRVFYENAIVPQNYLVGGLKGNREGVKIMLNSLDLEELSRVWSTFTQPFRLSVLYEISVVQLDAAAKEHAIAKRVVRIGKPEVAAPFSPPVVESMQPPAGKVESIITFQGSHLTNRAAYVTIMERLVLDGEKLTGNSFGVKVPADLPPGFHEIRVDISHLFRRTFNFEVTK